MFFFRRTMLVVTTVMNFVTVRPESPLVSVQPTASSVYDAVAPSKGHAGILCAESGDFQISDCCATRIAVFGLPQTSRLMKARFNTINTDPRFIPGREDVAPLPALTSETPTRAQKIS